MENVSADALAGILNQNFDFVLESYVLNEHKLCVKPVYKFIKAFISEKIPEFALVYSEADDPDEIFISVNSSGGDFDTILTEYPHANMTFHGNMPKAGEFAAEFTESFYFDKKIKIYADTGLRLRLLTRCDKSLVNSLGGESYLNVIFRDFVQNKIYRDCGIIGAFDKDNNFTGYIAYYEIAENIRDVSYIYVGEKFRGGGCGKSLLSFFADKNTEEGKISYYSCAENDISQSLVNSCGFTACAKRYETVYK